MTRALSRQAAVVAVSAIALAALLAVPVPHPAAAEPPALTPALRAVPADAAVFAHVDVAAIWASKLGDTFRSAKAPDLEKGLAQLKSATDLTPDDVKSVTIHMPQLKGPGDESAMVFDIALSKPYDKEKLLRGILLLDKTFTDWKEIEPGVFTHANDKDPGLRLVLKDPNRIVVVGPTYKGLPKEQPAADGPIAPAIRAAADGAAAVLGVNLANLPDEIRGDEVPAEVRPFQPLFRSDALIATGKLSGGEIKLDIRFRNQEKAKTADAEKSLAAGLFLAQTALGAALKELESAKGEEEKSLLPLARTVAEVLRTVRISVEGDAAVAQAVIKTDLPAGPFIESLFGGATGPRTASARAQSQNNLKQIGLALHNYHDVYNGFPPAALVDRRGKPMLSWRVLILPFIEQDALYREFKLDEPWDSEHNKKLLEMHPMPPVFALPGVTKEGEKTTHYQAFVGNGAIFDPIQPCKIVAITDGTSNTIMAATAAKAVPWTKPDDIPFDPKADPRELLLMKDDGVSVLFADGSVRFINKTIDPEVLRAMITKAGGEVIARDE
jgi:hypothetical protein